MKHTLSILSTYSADLFGICSALYELGGMCVMHDASGCNSTYNAHDEPRWYTMDSMVYISALTERDAIMGNDQKLIDDIVYTANTLSPKFIVVCGSIIPNMMGTDFKAIAKIIERKTDIPTFGINTNGMDTYLKGSSIAFDTLVKRFATSDIAKTERLSVNILGATPLDYSVNGSVDSMVRWLSDNQIEVVSCLAMGTSLQEVGAMGSASVNLVVSYNGLAVAETLYREFGTPYVVGVPIGLEYSKLLLEAIKRSADTKECIKRLDFRNTDAMCDYAIVGESVQSVSLANALYLEFGIDAKVVCPLDYDKDTLSIMDTVVKSEDEVSNVLKSHRYVIADPLYKPITSKDTIFYRLPHVAFSGRCYSKYIPNTINRSLKDLVL